MKNYKVFTINPGSTSTKVALFEDENVVFKETVVHDAAKLDEFPDVSDQLDYRLETINNILEGKGIDLADCDAFSGRGGGATPCEGGTYEVNDIYLNDARTNPIRHPATLGGQIAHMYARQYGKRAFFVNPPDTDELIDEARICGFKGIYRSVRTHALNHKETAIRVAEDLGKKYNDCNFVVAHLGGGISIGAHQKGKIIDSNDNVNGDGPMTPTRSGTIIAASLIEECFSGKTNREGMLKRVAKDGGFVDHLGTSEMRDVTKMIKEGNKYASIVYEAFIYQIIKQIGAMAAALGGKVDAVILTGGIANDKELCAKVTEKVSFIAPVEIRAGEFEMEALASGAIRVLSGEEKAREYTGVPVFNGFDF